jgi:hypothetical protein
MTTRSARVVTAILCFGLSIAFAASPLFVESFAGFDPNQFPVPQDNPPVQPAGYAFAIWGVIYGWLIIGLGWGLVRASSDAQWHDMRVPLCLSLAFGTGWLTVAVLSPVWAAALIWLMLVTALGALFLSPVQDRLWGAGPVGLYAGWLSAASCVSLGLLAAGFGFVSETTAALLFVGLAVLLATFVQAALGRVPTYGLAVVWALVAVVIQNMQSNLTIAVLGAVGAVIVLVPTLMAFRKG